MTQALIPLLYAQLAHAQERLVCPWCQAPDKSFTIARKAHGYVYNCYHASCTAQNPSKGFYRDQRNAAETYAPMYKKEQVREFPYETALLAPRQRRWLEATYNLHTASRLDRIRYSPDLERFVFVVAGPNYQTRGVIARSFDPEQKKRKTITYKRASPFTHWALPARLQRRIVVLVEDWLSAERVAQAGAIGLALLGTHFPQDAVKELIDYAPEEVIVALDADAVDKAFELRRNLGLFFPKIRVARLTKDLKDLKTDMDVQEVLGLC